MAILMQMKVPRVVVAVRLIQLVKGQSANYLFYCDIEIVTRKYSLYNLFSGEKSWLEERIYHKNCKDIRGSLSSVVMAMGLFCK